MGCLVLVCCSVLQCVAVCCSVLQCVAVCCRREWRLKHILLADVQVRLYAGNRFVLQTNHFCFSGRPPEHHLWHLSDFCTFWPSVFCRFRTAVSLCLRLSKPKKKNAGLFCGGGPIKRRHPMNLPYCNTLQHTATHCNTLQHTVPHCNAHYNTLQHTATHCNTLQHTATHFTNTHTYIGSIKL